jgi:23S rRNA (uracil1939-C5)-methyltransferase
LLPPPGSFLQASAEAEAEMERIVREHVKFASWVADLFSGCGTFALRLAAEASVLAAEGNAAAIEALRESVRAAHGLKPVTAEVRDLFRNPYGAAELARQDAVVLDPPRAGAAAQVAELAKSMVAKIAYVSCDPGTLARDLRTLVDGGYRIVRIHPIDQFLWSAHVEAVALLERAR